MEQLTLGLERPDTTRLFDEVIPKPDGGERLLGVPNVRDRVVQQAMKMVLEGVYEPTFSDHSHGFRPGRSQRTALREAQGYVRDGKEWVVDLVAA